MKERKEKNAAKGTPQLDLFAAAPSTQPAQDQVVPTPKVISMADHKHQREVKAFYDIANKLTSHLK
jgi:hypothetical protein